MESGVRFSFEITEDRGAALATKHKTYVLDAQVESEFEDYTKRHYASWEKFARDKRYGDLTRPVLVSGFDMTKDFAMVAYSNDGSSLGASLIITVPTLVTASASISGTHRTRCSPHTNYGPQEDRLLTHQRAIESEFPEGNVPIEFDQCVFLRYYSMRPRTLFAAFPKVIKAGAGPHNLPSRDNREESFPELTTLSDAEATACHDEDFEEQWTRIMDDNGSEADVVVRNTPYVLPLPCLLVNALTFSIRTTNTMHGVPSRTTYSR